MYNRVVEKFDTGRKTGMKILIKYLWLNKDSFFFFLIIIYIYLKKIWKVKKENYENIFIFYFLLSLLLLLLLNSNIISKIQLFFFNIEYLDNFSCWFNSFELFHFDLYLWIEKENWSRLDSLFFDQKFCIETNTLF